MASYTRMRVSLDEAQRKAFDAALLKVASKDIREQGPLEITQHLDEIIPKAKNRMHGKTAEQIIATAR